MIKHKKKIIELCIERSLTKDDSRIFCRAASYFLKEDDDDYNDIFLKILKEKFHHMKNENDEYQNRLFLPYIQKWAEETDFHIITLKEGR